VRFLAILANGLSHIDLVDTIRLILATVSKMGNIESLGSLVTVHTLQCGSQKTICKEHFIRIYEQLINADFLQEFTLRCFESDDRQIRATELSIFKHIGEAAPTDPMATHVMMLLDNFQHSGPNGTHRCFVFEPMGSTAASMVNKNRIKLFGKRVRYPKWMAKLILKHALLGLAFLHRNNIVHGDLQPGNLLFSISDINSLSEEELKQDQSQQDQSTTPQLLERLDGIHDIVFLGNRFTNMLALARKCW
jgi:hypothetical protein